ncbi:putative sterigmatocystin biosynthesis P450 monooxygenase STCB [Paramyrothecium foliicola]|nr:putative sterigmatocystin biosynthesis P450 monooxygenase STCB [Paramyrothecium foliicola]
MSQRQDVTTSSSGNAHGRNIVSESGYTTPANQDGTSLAELRPRILLGSTGEKVYVGSSAALSFLQFLRALLKRYNGPSEFTESQTRHSMLEAEVPKPTDDFNDFLDTRAKKELCEVFLQASAGFIFIFSDADIDRLLEKFDAMAANTTSADINSSNNNQDSLASLYTMIAIGAQCRGRDATDGVAACMYFTRAQQIAFRNMLHDPSLCMTANFILLAFFMFCACRRNTALLYLGVAARSAAILGLHLSELNHQLHIKEGSQRGRIWRSLRILDLHCNCILGRPTSTGLPMQQPVLDTNPSREHLNAMSYSHEELALNVNFNLCPILESISHTLTKRGSFDVRTAKEYLDLLKDWVHAIPDQLRVGIGQDVLQNNLASDYRRQTIANVHVACGYYYGVLLVSRPFLVARVTATLQNAHPSSTPRSDVGGSTSYHIGGLSNSELEDLAQTCVGAAVYLVQLSQDSMSADLLLGNMTILQAWVLAAGLVLGFSLMLPTEQRHLEAEGAFATSQDVLRALSRLSPQAQRNLDIITSFAEAITYYDQRIRPRAASEGNMLLERILPRCAAPSHEHSPHAQLGAVSEGQAAPPQGQEITQIDGFMDSFGGQVTDEIGFRQFWDHYVLNLSEQVTEPDNNLKVTFVGSSGAGQLTGHTIINTTYLSSAQMAVLPITAAFFATTLLIKYLFLDTLIFSPLSHVPGPRFFAVTKWRLAYEDWKGTRTRTIYRLHQEYGPAVRIGPNEVSFNSLTALRTIYGPGSRYGRTTFYRMFDVYGEQNLFTFHSPKEHGDRKKLLSHAYSKSSILRPEITSMVEAKARQYLELIENEPGHISEIFSTLHYYSLDNITDFVYGKYGATFALQGSKSHKQLIADIVHPSRRKLSWCLVHFNWLTKWLYQQTGLMGRLVKPILPMQQPTTYTGIRGYALQAFKDFRADEEKINPINEKHISIMERLWQYHETQRVDGMRDMQIASECADHFLAGIDTTSDTLMFLVWSLSLPGNEKFQEKLRAEVLALPKDALNQHGNPKAEASDQCTYLSAIIKETLRLYAPLPSTEPRSLDGESVVDGYTIPGGSVVGMSPWILHRNPDVFKDPLIFKPDRWLGPEAVELNRWFWGFSSGGRMCIGMHLAMAEMTTLVATLYREYQTSIAPGFEGITPAITARVETFYDDRITFV